MNTASIITAVASLAAIIFPVYIVVFKGIFNTVGKAIDSKKGVNKGAPIFSDRDRTGEESMKYARDIVKAGNNGYRNYQKYEKQSQKGKDSKSDYKSSYKNGKQARQADSKQRKGDKKRW